MKVTLPLIIASGLLLLVLLACGSQIPLSGQTGAEATAAPQALVGPRGEFCTIASPLSWDRTDSDKTIEEIKRYNCRGNAICGWGGDAEAKTCTAQGSAK